MKSKIRNLIEKGFFYIFGANVLNAIIGFAGSILIIRILSKEDFGLFSYSQNILSFFLLFNALGVTSGMLQFGSETTDSNRRNSIFRYGIQIGIIFNIFISLLILIYGKYLPLSIEEARPIILSMFLLPLFMFLFESIQTYFRTTLKNKEFSTISIINAVSIFMFSIAGAYFFDAVGVMVFRYFAYLVTIILGVILLKKAYIKVFKSKNLKSTFKKSFLKFSLISSFNNAISQMLYVIDVFLVGLIIVDINIIASYKTATIIPIALNFIPISIMMFIYPYFARNSTNHPWIKKNYLHLTKYMFIANFVITTLLIILAPFIVRILFGSEYNDAVATFRILSFGYLIASTFRIPIGNILLMLKKVKFLLYLAIITGVLNIVLDIVLIQKYGSIGAAIATVVVYFFTSIIGGIYLYIILNKRKSE